MITGSITAVSRERAIEYSDKMWCPECEEWQQQDARDASYDDAYGKVEMWEPNGICQECGAEMEEDHEEVDA